MAGGGPSTSGSGVPARPVQGGAKVGRHAGFTRWALAQTAQPLNPSQVPDVNPLGGSAFAQAQAAGWRSLGRHPSSGCCLAGLVRAWLPLAGFGRNAWEPLRAAAAAPEPFLILLARTCSTRAIRTCLTESRWRASHSTAGTPRVEVEREPHVLRVVARGAVEAVDRDDEREPAPLEVVDGREAVGQPAGVGQHHRAERTEGQLVPHEPEPVLAGRAEQVQHQVGDRW